MTQDNNLSNYLNSKSDNLSCQRYTRSFADINNANDAKTVITNILNNNIEDVQISLGTYNADKEPITYKNVQTGDKYSFYTGHIATIVDYDDKGIYVSTWGEEYFVSYSELYGQENCYIEITNIDMK